MKTVEQQLKELILSKHKSVLDFTKTVGMPYSTVDNIFKRGVRNANITNIIKICAALGIDTESLASGVIVASATKEENTPNQIVIFAKDGNKAQYELTDAELQAILTLLESMKKNK